MKCHKAISSYRFGNLEIQILRKTEMKSRPSPAPSNNREYRLIRGFWMCILMKNETSFIVRIYAQCSPQRPLYFISDQCRNYIPANGIEQINMQVGTKTLNREFGRLYFNKRVRCKRWKSNLEILNGARITLYKAPQRVSRIYSLTRTLYHREGWECCGVEDFQKCGMGTVAEQRT